MMIPVMKVVISEHFLAIIDKLGFHIDHFQVVKLDLLGPMIHQFRLDAFFVFDEVFRIPRF